MRSLPTGARRLARVAALSALTAVLLAAAAPLASASSPALLCGYPLKRCAPGQTNPVRPTPLAPGYLLASQSSADKARKTPFMIATSSGADQEVVSTSEVVTIRVGSLPKNASALAFVVLHSGKLAPIGAVKIDAAGRTTLPALRFSRPGDTTIQLRTSNGTLYEVRVYAQKPGS